MLHLLFYRPLGKFDSEEVKEATASGSEVIWRRKSKYNNGLVIETHYWIFGPDFTISSESKEIVKSEARRFSSKPLFANGPFVALKLGAADNFQIDAFTVGWMVGCKRNPMENGSWNIGIGYSVNTRTRKDPYLDSSGQVAFKEIDSTGVALTLGTSY
ncbi:MAG: hypothetical protein WA705_17110 [Candidatus Ozemobacteraceae bacterium]